MPNPMARGALAHRHGTGTGPPTNTAPVNTAAPTVAGTPAVGNTLTATPGTWTGTPTPTLAYQWERNSSDIPGATGLTYVLVTADVGNNIRVRETGTNVAGTANAWSAVVVMPVPSLTNTAAAGTNAATVTTGNSGGSGDTAWNTVTIGSGAALVYDNTAANVASGLGYKVTLGATQVAVTMKWSTALSVLPATGRLTGRFYYVPAGSGPRLIDVLGGGGLLCAFTHSNTAGVGIRVADTGNTGRGVGQGVSLTNGTLYRVEFDVTGIGAGAAAGDSSVYCYLGNTNTQVGSTDTVTGVNFGSVAYDTVSFGVNAGGVVSASMWLDGFSLNANGVLPGPEPASGFLTPTATGDLTPTATGTLVPF
jgi:hypothetical protein